MFKKPMLKRFNELGTGGVRADDVKDHGATNPPSPLKRICIEGLIYREKLRSLLDKHGDQIPERVRDLAHTCVEVGEVFNNMLEQIGEDPPIVIRTESTHRYSLEALPPVPPLIL